VLCLPHKAMPEQKGLKRFYDPRCFTPESVRQDETIPWQSGSFFHGGAFHPIRYKELKTVLWRKGAARRLLRLIVIAPTGYRLHQQGRLLYRQPAFLLSTDRHSPIEELIAAYLERWQIEVNHREEKSTLGLGDAQVPNPLSVPRQPALVVRRLCNVASGSVARLRASTHRRLSATTKVGASCAQAILTRYHQPAAPTVSAKSPSLGAPRHSSHRLGPGAQSRRLKKSPPATGKMAKLQPWHFMPGYHHLVPPGQRNPRARCLRDGRGPTSRSPAGELISQSALQRICIPLGFLNGNAFRNAHSPIHISQLS
jgi:hypothetical protein